MFFVLIVTRKSLLINLELIIFIYFRGFSLGILISSLMMINFIWCVFIIVLELLLSINLFTLLINDILKIKQIDSSKLLYITLLSVFIYSLFLEIVGGKFG